MSLFDRAKNILVTPKTEWEVIKTESLSVGDMFTKYAMILAAIPAIAGLIGYSVFGFSYGFGSFHLPIGTGILWTISTYILSLAGIYILAFIIDALAPSFGSTKDMSASMKVAVFSYTASWIAGILMIFPVISWIAIIGSIYSLVLLFMGLRSVKEVPQEKLTGYFIVTLVIAVVIYLLAGWIVSSIVFRGYYSTSVF